MMQYKITYYQCLNSRKHLYCKHSKMLPIFVLVFKLIQKFQEVFSWVALQFFFFIISCKSGIYKDDKKFLRICLFFLGRGLHYFHHFFNCRRNDNRKKK